MKTIQVSKGRWQALVDDTDYEILDGFSWHGHYSHNKKLVYPVTILNGRIVQMGRIVCGLFNKPSTIEPDHIDGNPLNNQRVNLRKSTKQQQQMNRGPKNGVRFKGVEKRGERWRVRCGPKNNRIEVGRFDSEEEAARAYDKVALKLYGEFARLNFPKPLL